eukprot:jgi/Psemu1/23270/gm1.23270_g
MENKSTNVGRTSKISTNYTKTINEKIHLNSNASSKELLEHNIITSSDEVFVLPFLYNDYNSWLNTTKGTRKRKTFTDCKSGKKEGHSDTGQEFYTYYTKDLEIEVLKAYQQQNGNHTQRDKEDKENRKEQRQKQKYDMIETLDKDDEDYKYYIKNTEMTKIQLLTDRFMLMAPYDKSKTNKPLCTLTHLERVIIYVYANWTSIFIDMNAAPIDIHNFDVFTIPPGATATAHPTLFNNQAIILQYQTKLISSLKQSTSQTLTLHSYSIPMKFISNANGGYSFDHAHYNYDTPAQLTLLLDTNSTSSQQMCYVLGSVYKVSSFMSCDDTYFVLLHLGASSKKNNDLPFTFMTKIDNDPHIIWDLLHNGHGYYYETLHSIIAGMHPYLTEYPTLLITIHPTQGKLTSTKYWNKYNHYIMLCALIKHNTQTVHNGNKHEHFVNAISATKEPSYDTDDLHHAYDFQIYQIKENPTLFENNCLVCEIMSDKQANHKFEVCPILKIIKPSDTISSFSVNSSNMARKLLYVLIKLPTHIQNPLPLPLLTTKCLILTLMLNSSAQPNRGFGKADSKTAGSLPVATIFP